MARRHWSDDEIAYLNRYYGIKTHEAIAKKLGRTEWAVKCKAYSLNLHREVAKAKEIKNKQKGVKIDLEPGDRVSIREVSEGRGIGRGERICHGEVVHVHPRYIVVQMSRYRESFLVSDVLIGRVSIERRRSA